MDTWAKEAVEPTDQGVGIQWAAENANGGTHANGAAGVWWKYGVAGISCKYGAEGLCLLLARNGGTDGTCTLLRRHVDSRQAPMDPLLLCGALRLSLCGAPTVSPCECGAPSIMLCGELQPVDADMPILIRGAQAPCAKSLLNPSDDA